MEFIREKIKEYESKYKWHNIKFKNIISVFIWPLLFIVGQFLINFVYIVGMKITNNIWLELIMKRSYKNSF